MKNRPLTPRHLSYSKFRAQGMSVPQAFRAAGYTSYKTNAYRLENRPDIQTAIADFQAQRGELLTEGDTALIKAEDLSDVGVTQNFLLQTLLDALAQARTMGDPKTVLAITTKLADLLAIRFDPATLRDDSQSAASLLKQLEALK
jgi:hypothetical protein